MGLKKYKLGELISLCDERNSENKFTKVSQVMAHLHNLT